MRDLAPRAVSVAAFGQDDTPQVAVSRRLIKLRQNVAYSRYLLATLLLMALPTAIASLADSRR